MLTFDLYPLTGSSRRVIAVNVTDSSHHLIPAVWLGEEGKSEEGSTGLGLLKILSIMCNYKDTIRSENIKERQQIVSVFIYIAKQQCVHGIHYVAYTRRPYTLHLLRSYQEV